MYRGQQKIRNYELGLGGEIYPKGRGKYQGFALTSVAQLVGALFGKPKICRFNSQSGHMARLQVQSPVGTHMRGNQLMFLSHIDVSLPPCPSL